LLAGERFKEALHEFTSANSEPHRLATLLNLAHLARENGHWDDSVSLYAEVIALAIRTGQPDVELGARAGAGLTALAVGRVGAAEEEARTIAARLDARPGWWFWGREIVDALLVRLAAGNRDFTGASRMLNEGIQMSEAHNDLYATAWLVAECAPALPSDIVPFPLISELTQKIEAHGFAGLSARFATLRLILSDGSGKSWWST
jgi:hypothetical protein